MHIPTHLFESPVMKKEQVTGDAILLKIPGLQNLHFPVAKGFSSRQLQLLKEERYTQDQIYVEILGLLTMSRCLELRETYLQNPRMTTESMKTVQCISHVESF